MYTNILILCLASYLADTLWTVDFSTFPSEWTAGSQWQWLDDSAYLDISSPDWPPGYLFNADSLFSPIFIVPASSDSLVVAFNHYWWGHGSSNAATEWAQSTSTLSLQNVSEQGQVFQLWEITGFCQAATNYVSYSIVDSGCVAVPLLGASHGDTVFFQFHGLVETYLDYMAAHATIEWNLYSFHILSYESQQHIAPMTWGSIKATF
ncbi:MAG: hypothetical protein U9P42_10470 [Candidatus Fermentibacteria bacterium]|nr:hypothetical protein [Candidatus Fermentibacteria bacterium]